MWKLKEALRAVVEFLEDPQEKREDLVELAMDLWDAVDPLPGLDLDDAVVETIAEYIVDWIIQNYSEGSSLS